MSKALKRILVLIILFPLLIGAVLSTPIAEYEAYAKEDQPACVITEKSTEAVLNYLNEVYIQKYPELGLELLYDSPTDKKELHKLREEITNGISDKKQIADALNDWIIYNIEYDEICMNVCTPASVIRHGAAVCYGFANLLQAFLRDSGIPAVVCCGVHGDMSKCTVEGMRNDDYCDQRHAWVFAYINNQWLLYDPLFGFKGVNVEKKTGKELLIGWYYADYLEGIIPYYDGIDFSMPIMNAGFFYKNGKFYQLVDGEFNENYACSTDSNAIEFCGYQYYESKQGSYFVETEDGTDDLSGMEDGELISSGWLIYTYTDGERKYITQDYLYDNGMKATQTIVFKGDQAFYCMYDVNAPISKEIAETCRMDMGKIILHVGDSIKWNNWMLEKEGVDSKTFEIISGDGKVEIEDNGLITAVSAGSVGIQLTIEYDGGFSGTFFSLIVEDDLNNVGGEIKELQDQEYTGEEIKPYFEVYANGKKLVKNGQYRVKYENNKEVGTAKVIVSGVGEYSGEITAEFKIVSSSEQEDTNDGTNEEQIEEVNTDTVNADTEKVINENNASDILENDDKDDIEKQTEADEEKNFLKKYGLDDKYVPEGYVDESGSPMIIEGKDLDWNVSNEKSYWYEGGIKQGTYYDPKGVIGDGTNRGREICDNNIKDDNGNGTWFWLDSCYDGAKAVGKEVWVPYIYQQEDEWDDETKHNIAFESDEGMGDCVLNAIRSKAGKWVRYDEKGRMLKGWVTIEGALAGAYPDQAGNTYYYDTRTGLMAKGWVALNGTNYYFDETTGALVQ